MESSTAKNPSFTPMPMADLLPGLSGLMSKDAIQTLTAKKQPRATMAHSRTAEKNVQPLTLAELKTAILALKPESSRRLTQAQSQQSGKKRDWNSSVKVNYKVSHTANGQMKNNPVRKVLNFQPKPKAPAMPSRVTINPETSKFPKPEARAKKSLYSQASSSVRISGICNIPQTPVGSVKPIRSRMTLANKENNPHQANVKKAAPPTPKSLINRRKLKVPDTPLTNSPWKSGSDASFLQKEKEINDVEEKVKAITEEPTLENIAEVSPPVSTPFKDYRSVQEYFNTSSGGDNSALYDDNTIMCFDKPNENTEETAKRDESVIVSLCDLLKKTTVNNEDNTELENLLEIEQQIRNNIKLLTEMKEAELKSLENVTKLINEKRNKSESETDKNTADKTLIQKTPKVVTIKTPSPVKSPIISRPCSVIKSPTYRIPKKNLNLRKKVICKSMPDVSTVLSPVKGLENRALSIYMQMKDDMKFLSTPKVNRTVNVPDTPAVTSHNLQKQLDKLYGS